MLRNIFGKKYHHLNKILISKSALKYNHQLIQEFHQETKIAPVLKSNAYGHGLNVVAPIFDSFNPVFLVVDSLYEAYELTKLKVKAPILILGYTHPDNFSVKRLHFHITVFDLEVARSLNDHQSNCNVHIFVDTGMSREGVPLNDLPTFVAELKKLSNLKIVGLASHFADADNPTDNSFTKKQITNFKKALKILQQQGIDPQYRHISASGGAFKIKDSVFNVIRAGLASYGLNPLESSDGLYQQLLLRPALCLNSTLASIKTIKNRDRVGYNGTFIANSKMKIGLLPLGYYEGVDRRLSNRGFVSLNGTICPILGRVSMNMTSIDLSKVDNPQVGDQVSIYSNQLADVNNVVNAAKTAETIPYELLVHLAASIRRELVL